MRKRILSLVLIFCMVLTLMPATAFASEESGTVTEIGTAETFANISNGGSFKLTTSIAVSTGVSIASSKEVTLDLNGNTLTYNGTNALFTMSGGTLTITDSFEGESGSIECNSGKAFDFPMDLGAMVSGSASSAGTLNIQGGTIKCDNNNVIAVSAYSGTGVLNITGGTLEGKFGIYISGNTGVAVSMTGGTIKASGSNANPAILADGNVNVTIGGDAYVECSNGNVIDAKGTSNITITGNAHLNLRDNFSCAVVYTWGNSTVTISGGTIEGDRAIRAQNNSTVTISGGTIKGGTAGTSGTEMSKHAVAAEGNSTVTITDGTITGTVRKDQSGTPQSTLTVSGGTFSTDVKDYLASGAVTLPGDNDGVVVYASEAEKQEKAVATVETDEGTQYFGSLAAAVAAATGDDATVTLLNDAALSAEVEIENTVTIASTNGSKITRTSGNTGTFFTVADGATLTLDGVTIDAGGKWSIDEEAWATDYELSHGQNTAVYGNSGWLTANHAEDPINKGDGNVVTTDNLIKINGTGGLVLDGGTVIENIYADTKNVHVIGWGDANNETANKIEIKNATIRHFAGTGGSLIAANGRLVDITLDDGATLTDNFNRGDNGGLFYLSSGGSKLTMKAGAKVTDNKVADCNGSFIMTYANGATEPATFTMEGGEISGNIGLKGESNNYCQPVYAHRNGVFVMNGGKITNNTGCYVGAFYQRIDNLEGEHTSAKVQLNGGEISGNHYYGEDAGVLDESTFGQIFITDDATIGKDMTITGDVSFYGQAKATVEGTITGNVHIYAEQQSTYKRENNEELKGTITGNVIVENGAKATNSGTINGNVTVEPRDEEDQHHSNGAFVNSDEGTISGTVTLEPGTSIQLGDGTVTAGSSGATFTVSGTTVTLSEGTLNAANCEDITFVDSDNNELEPANGNGNGEVMILVARVTHGNQVNMGFDSFAGAIAYAKAQSEENNGVYTVTLVKDAEGEGIDIGPSATGKTPVVVIDFGGHTYTLTNAPVGSTGTQTQGLRVKKGATVTLKNGTLKVGTGPDKFLWLINNYGSLTVENMTLDGTNLVMPGNSKEIYTLNNNSGEVSITKTTFIDSNSLAEGKIYSVCAHYSENYGTASEVTIDSESVFNYVIVTRDADEDSTVDDMMAYVEYNGVKYGIDATDKTADSYIVFTKTDTTLAPVLPEYTLSYSALANADIVSDCAPQTMWVQFNEALPVNTWLWFEITDKEEHTYGIVGHADKAGLTKMAWSFLNREQFESWPTGVEEIAGGEATVKCYVLPGKVEGQQTTSPTPKYFAWTKTVEVQSEMIPQAAPPVVNMDTDKVPADQQTAVQTAAEQTAMDSGHMAELTQEAMTEATAPTDAAVTEALEEGGVEPEEGQDVHVVVQTYMDVKVDSYTTDSTSEAKSLTLDITPMYRVVATTAESVNEIAVKDDPGVSNANAVVIGTEHVLPVTKPVTLTIGLPSGFATANETVYIQHKGIYEYTGTAAQSGDNLTVTFTNPHGFSEFTVSTKPAAVAEIGTQRYMTLQDAVDHVQNGETIVVTGDCSNDTVTINRAVTFTVKVDGGEIGDNTITAGSGCTMTSTENADGSTTYTVVSAGTPTYTVTVPANPNGTVTVSPKSATAGTTITVTVTPKEGYTVDTVTATQNGTGTAVTVTKNADGTYSFTMPAGGATVKATFVEGTKPAPSAKFTDVVKDAWYVDAINYVVKNGLMNGVSETDFAPNDQTNRAMLVTILYRLDGEPAVTKNIPFSDVASGKWYSDAINWAAANEIVGGYGDGTFRPERDLTREEAATILYRYATYKKYDVTTTAELTAYTDAASVQSYATAPMSWAVGTELINGTTETTLAPSGGAIRAQIATILMRFCENIVK